MINLKTIKVPERVLKIALEESKKTNIKKARLSALSIDKKFCVLFKTHNIKLIGRHNCFSIHAEHRLITKYRSDINTILVFRNVRHLFAADSRPCKRCMFLIREAGIKNVIFFENGFWYKGKVR